MTMTLTETLIQEHTCRGCGEEFPTVAEVVDHGCPHAPPVPANARPNRYEARCYDCGNHVGVGEGWIVRGDDGWQTRHTAACPAPGFVVADGQFHRLGNDIYRVRQARTSRRPYASRAIIHTDPTSPYNIDVEWVYMGRTGFAAMSETTLLTWEQAREFGCLTNRCVRCSIELSDDRSIAAGYGETCAGHMGWPYPNAAEAQAILAERTQR